MRYPGILAKQADIQAELDRFREETWPDAVSLSREMREIVEHIHRDLFAPDLSVQNIKSRCRIRDNNISCRFRREIGLTIRDYIESLRIEAAIRLLEKNVPVFDVAMAVGYDHPQTFYRAFHRKFDCTPASLRRDDTTGLPELAC